MAAIVGIGATTATATNWRGRWHKDGDAVALALELALAALLVAVWVAGRRSSHADHLATLLRMTLRRVIALTMLGVAIVAYVNVAGHRFGRQLLQNLTGGHKERGRIPRQAGPRPQGPGANLHIDYALLLYAILAVVLLAAVVGCVVMIIRRQRGPAGYLGDEEDESAVLRQAVESGQAALRSVDDARAAIIACYVAMESSLARAGTARIASETPDELLTRAAAAGLVHGPAAAQLTELFYEARFSTHALPQSARDGAGQSLDELLAGLGEPATAGAPGTGGVRR
jgi:Domain of unknown function (DUF4129)